MPHRETRNFKFIPSCRTLRQMPVASAPGFVHRAVMRDFPDLSGVQLCLRRGDVDGGAARLSLRSAACPAEEFFADSFLTEPTRPRLPRPLRKRRSSEEDTMSLTRELIQDGIAERGTTTRSSSVRLSQGTMGSTASRKRRSSTRNFWPGVRAPRQPDSGPAGASSHRRGRGRPRRCTRSTCSTTGAWPSIPTQSRRRTTREGAQGTGQVQDTQVLSR